MDDDVTVASQRASAADGPPAAQRILGRSLLPWPTRLRGYVQWLARAAEEARRRPRAAAAASNNKERTFLALESRSEKGRYSRTRQTEWSRLSSPGAAASAACRSSSCPSSAPAFGDDALLLLLAAPKGWGCGGGCEPPVPTAEVGEGRSSNQPMNPTSEGWRLLVGQSRRKGKKEKL